MVPGLLPDRLPCSTEFPQKLSGDETVNQLSSMLLRSPGVGPATGSKFPQGLLVKLVEQAEDAAAPLRKRLPRLEHSCVIPAS